MPFRNVANGAATSDDVPSSVTLAMLERNVFRFVFALMVLISPALAECDGQFTPVAGTGSPFSQVHFFPKNGNRIVIAGASRVIPPAVGVMSGGVVGTFDDASIDRAESQKLAGNTLYFVYVYMDGDAMKLDFSTTGHKEDVTFGNEVHATDPGRSLVGMVRTNAEGRFVGDSKSQLTLSWCNRVSVGLTEHLEGLTTNLASLAEADPKHRLEWLQWGINNSFTQGADVPNIYLSMSVKNDKVGSYVNARIAIDGQIVGNLGTHYQSSEHAVGQIFSATTGWGDEGYHYAQVMMDHGGGGGVMSVISGILFTSPLRS